MSGQATTNARNAQPERCRAAGTLSDVTITLSHDEALWLSQMADAGLVAWITACDTTQRYDRLLGGLRAYVGLHDSICRVERDAET